jgi:hypothetical protein
LLFPAGFDRIVRVYNHSKADHLLAKHDELATNRDAAVRALDRARTALVEAQQAAGIGGGSGVGPLGEAGGGGDKAAAPAAPASIKALEVAPTSKAVAKASEQLAKAEVALAEWEEKVTALEAEIVAAQAEALTKPLGTAFIALFK